VAVKNRPFRERLGFAFGGARFAWASEKSFRTQVVIGVVALAALAALRPPAAWWALCVLSAALVLAAELVNTALEVLIDHLHPERHERIRVAKDCAAAAVLVLSVAAAIVGCMTVLAALGRS
jgi:diacylglycerol kinase (ATP)